MTAHEATPEMVLERRARLAPMPPPPLFTFDALVVTTEAGQRIIDIEHLTIDEGGITVLAGPSGAGKSTLLRLCNRLDAPTSGSVCLRGRDVADLDPLALRRRVGMVFQRPTLFPGTVRDNLLVASAGATDGALVDVLDRSGLPQSFLDRIGDDLSGGEAQRACLARTLLTEPDVLLMDEPTSALDQAMTERLEATTRDLVAGSAVSVLWVSHDVGQVERLGDRVVRLDRGRVVDDGRPPEPRQTTDAPPRDPVDD